MSDRKFTSQLFVLVLAGCSTPEPATLTPEIEGVLVVDGKPAKNVEVSLGFTGNYDKPCPAESTTRTDGDGRFHIAARTTPKATEQTTESFLCFRLSGELVQATMKLTSPDEKRKHVATCRLPGPLDAHAEDTQVCSWRYG